MTTSRVGYGPRFPYKQLYVPIEDIYAMPPVPQRFIPQKPPISEERAACYLEKAQAMLTAAMKAINADERNASRTYCLSAESIAMHLLRHALPIATRTLAQNLRAQARMMWSTPQLVTVRNRGQEGLQRKNDANTTHNP